MDEIVRGFLGDQTSALELKQMREALNERLRRLLVEAESDPRAFEELKPRIEQVRRQIRTLAEEEAITGFVEETVRASLADVGPVSPDSAPHESSIPPWASIDVDDSPEEL